MPMTWFDVRRGHITSTSSPAPGTPTMIVPLVVGQSVVSEVAELQNLGFGSLAPGQEVIALGPAPDRRRVTGQDPPAGIQAPAGSTVVLTFSGRWPVRRSSAERRSDGATGSVGASLPGKFSDLR